MKFKPMLAGKLEKLSDIKYPCYCTPKLDGIRCLIIDGVAVSRSLKPIRNKYIQAKLRLLPNNLDGELIVPNKKFNEVSSAVMSTDGEPDFTYCVFDLVNAWGYKDRIIAVQQLELQSFVSIVMPLQVNNEQEFLQAESFFIETGNEGIMIRSEDGPYKYGRSTVREGWLLKWKAFRDSEAVVVDIAEMMGNQNEAQRNKLGNLERSSHKANLIPKNTLGSLLVNWNGVEFNIGTGFNDKQREEIWKNRNKYIGKLVKFKYQPHGAKEAPRFPVFLGFRDKEDL